MSELPITPFAPLPGVQPLGADSAGMCVDGVCAVPEQTAPARTDLPRGEGSAGR